MKGVPITLTPAEKQKKRKKDEEGIRDVRIAFENGQWNLFDFVGYPRLFCHYFLADERCRITADKQKFQSPPPVGVKDGKENRMFVKFFLDSPSDRALFEGYGGNEEMIADGYLYVEVAAEDEAAIKAAGGVVYHRTTYPSGSVVSGIIPCEKPENMFSHVFRNKRGIVKYYPRPKGYPEYPNRIDFIPFPEERNE